jgi:hypothetical protein
VCNKKEGIFMTLDVRGLVLSEAATTAATEVTKAESGLNLDSNDSNEHLFFTT